MNFKIIGRIMSWILMIEAAFMLPAALVSWIYAEHYAMIVLLICTALTGSVGVILYFLCRKARMGMFARDGLVCVGLSWIVMSLFGCLPFWLSGEIPSFVDALFEIVSGFTTTGASILNDVEAMSHGMLYWRSFSHWVGGMGVLVFLLAVLPRSGKYRGYTMHILRAERYKGDAILQKTYCTDYIKKTFVVNDGSEIPKYYAQNSHPAIVSAEVFDLTQMELEWRRSLKGSYSGKSCFASRIVCGDCGAFYGSKVWHSTDEYRRTIWRCNNKYEGDKKCSTPHVTQEELEKAFVDVMQKGIAEKDVIFAVCREVLDEVLDTSELDRIATRLQDQALGMAERVRKLVEENARVRRDQEEYQREYDALATEHEKLSEKIRSVEAQKKDKADRRRRIEVFLRMLEEQKEYMGFEPYTFVALVDKLVVGQDRKLEITFRNGMKYEYTINS